MVCGGDGCAHVTRATIEVHQPLLLFLRFLNLGAYDMLFLTPKSDLEKNKTAAG